MKHGSTLKIEILGPEGQPWSAVKPRLFALRKTAAQGLTMTMQDLHGDAVGEIRSIWDGESKKNRVKAKEWRARAEKTLRENWNEALRRERAFREASATDAAELDRTCAPITEPLTAETVDNILARFSGQHFKDLIAGRSAFPSFVNGVAFYARSRGCSISGTPDAARLSFPLWGTGSKATTFVLAPGGGSARAQWRKLVADFARRGEVVALEADLKNAAKKKFAEKKLAQLGLTKLGRVGLTYDERRRKWFAVVSFIQYSSDNVKEGQKAAVNFGVNVFIQALTEDGHEWHEDGDQILEKRVAGASIRKRIQRSMRTFGSGSKGRGKARRELPLTKRRGDEARFVETYIRQLSAALISWCRLHNVSDLYLEDMTGIREQFERDTEGQAHEEVKRRIHQWPYYQTTQALEREGAQRGVRVHAKSAHYVSQRCPSCKHTAPENVIRIDRTNGPVVEINGQRYRQITETWTRFECQKCGLKGKGDIIACANHLADVGATHALEKQQEKARERIDLDKEKVKNGKHGKGSNELQHGRSSHPRGPEGLA